MTEYPALIRKATPEDVDSLLLFVPPIVAENTLLPVSMIKIEDLIERCAYRRSGAIAGVIDGEDGIDAGVGLVFAETETSDVPYLRAAWFGLHSSVRKHPPRPDDPRAHYGRTLFQFCKWVHENLEVAAGHPILLQFDIATKTMLGAKMRLMQRNTTQVGASFAFGTAEKFTPQRVISDTAVA